MAIYTLPGGGIRVNVSRGGSCFTANSSGFIIRKKRKPLLKRTQKTTQQRVNFRNVVSNYRLMSPGEKADWKTKSPQFSRTNSLGISYDLLGNQLFQGLNQNRVQQGEVINEIAPNATVFPSRTIVSTSFDITPVDIFIVLDVTTVPIDFTFNIFANFVSNSVNALTFPNDYNFIESFPVGSHPTFDFSANYVQIFGNGPAVPPGPAKDWFIQIALQATYLPSGEKKILDLFTAFELL